MSTEQRFAWMESMLDTTINCYEAHREALEKVYADLYGLHTGNGCIHLSPSEAECMLRAIADVLEKHALKLPPFEGEERESSSGINNDHHVAPDEAPAEPSSRESSRPPSAQGGSLPAASVASATAPSDHSNRNNKKPSAQHSRTASQRSGGASGKPASDVPAAGYRAEEEDRRTERSFQSPGDAPIPPSSGPHSEAASRGGGSQAPSQHQQLQPQQQQPMKSAWSRTPSRPPSAQGGSLPAASVASATAPSDHSNRNNKKPSAQHSRTASQRSGGASGKPASDVPAAGYRAEEEDRRTESSFQSPGDALIPPPSGPHSEAASRGGGSQAPSQHQQQQPQQQQQHDDSRSPSQVERTSVKPSSRPSSRPNDYLRDNSHEYDGEGEDVEDGNHLVDDQEADEELGNVAGSVSDAPPRPSTRDSSAEQQHQQQQQQQQRPSSKQVSRVASGKPSPPPPANLPTIRHKTPSVASSNQHGNSISERSSNKHVSSSYNDPSYSQDQQQPQERSRRAVASATPSQRSTPASQHLSQRGYTNPDSKRMEERSAPSATPSQRSAVAPAVAPATTASSRASHGSRANEGSPSSSRRRTQPGVPLTPWPIDESKRRQELNDSRNNPPLAEQFHNYRHQQPPSTEDPTHNPYARNSNYNSNSKMSNGHDEDPYTSVLPVRRDSISDTSSLAEGGSNTPSAMRNTIHNDNKKGHGLSASDRPRNVQGSTAAADKKKQEERNAYRPSTTSSHASGFAGTNRDMYGEPDGMVNSVAPRMRENFTKHPPPHTQQNGDGCDSEVPASATPNGGSFLADAEEPEPRHNAAASTAPMALYDPPMPKHIAPHRPLRTATPRRHTGTGNNSHQIEDLVYKRRVSPARNGGPVLEDDPAVDDYLGSEDARLQARKDRELQEIRSAPGCLTDAQRKRQLALQYTSASNAAAAGALMVTGGSENAALTTTAASRGVGKPLMTAAEAQLTKERQLLHTQLEKMQHEWAITTSKMRESGNEPRYRQLQSRMDRVRTDLDRVERELATVQNIEAKRARGIPVSRSTSRAKS